jgi:hypothetical protein
MSWHEGSVTHHDISAGTAYGDHGVVALWAASRRVNDDPDGGVEFDLQGLHAKRKLDVALAKDLLQRVEGKAGELRLDEVGSVLHL